MDALVNGPVKEPSSLLWGSVLAWSSSSECCLLYLPSQFFKQCWVLLHHTKEHGLKRQKSLSSAGCEREIWLLFCQHVREVYSLWYVRAENRNTKPSVGAVGLLHSEKAQRGGNAAMLTFFPMIISRAYAQKHWLYFPMPQPISQSPTHRIINVQRISIFSHVQERKPKHWHAFRLFSKSYWVCIW